MTHVKAVFQSQEREENSVLTRVAAHVHADTIPDAIRPGFTLLDALLNSSELLGENAVYRACRAVRPSMKALKNRPIPVTSRVMR